MDTLVHNLHKLHIGQQAHTQKMQLTDMKNSNHFMLHSNRSDENVRNEKIILSLNKKYHMPQISS